MYEGAPSLLKIDLYRPELPISEDVVQAIEVPIRMGRVDIQDFFYWETESRHTTLRCTDCLREALSSKEFDFTSSSVVHFSCELFLFLVDFDEKFMFSLPLVSAILCLIASRSRDRREAAHP